MGAGVMTAKEVRAKLNLKKRLPSL
jgi:hypothetical protein